MAPCGSGAESGLNLRNDNAGTRDNAGTPNSDKKPHLAYRRDFCPKRCPDVSRCPGQRGDVCWADPFTGLSADSGETWCMANRNKSRKECFGGETNQTDRNGNEEFMNSVPEGVSILAGKKAFTGRRGDPMKAPRCGAKTRQGNPCRRAAERNPWTNKLSRCRLHGGLSSGPKTPQGKARIAAAAFRHGRFTTTAKQARVDLQKKLNALRSDREGMTL